MANQVTLTFTGETTDLEQSFDRVGASAREMDGDVRASADAFDRVGEAADTVDTRAMGFRDTVTGIQDGMLGIKKVSQDGLGFESILLLGMGVGDLASGIFNFLVPSLKSAVTWLKATRVGVLATAAAQRIAAVGAKVWAGMQWLLNVALMANPIGLVVLAIVALVAIFVIAWNRSETFRRIVTGAWMGIRNAALAVWRWLSGTLWPGISSLLSRIASAFAGLPGRIASAFRTLVSVITWPFRTAFNGIARLWNSTVGRLSFSFPSWVPGIGGMGFTAPRIPTFHSGGRVPGMPGQEMLAILQGGERVVPAHGASEGGTVIEVRGGYGTSAEQALASVFTHLVRVGAISLAVRGDRVVAHG